MEHGEGRNAGWARPDPFGARQELLRLQDLFVLGIDRRFDDIGGQVADMRGQLANMGRRLADTGNELAGLRRDMLGHFDDIYRRFERLEQEYQAITQALRRIEAGLAGEGRRREILERDLGELKQRVAALQTRIEEIEQRLGN